MCSAENLLMRIGSSRQREREREREREKFNVYVNTKGDFSVCVRNQSPVVGVSQNRRP